MREKDPSTASRPHDLLWEQDLDGADRRIEALILRPPHPDRPEALDYGRRLAAIRDGHAEIRRALRQLGGIPDADRARREVDLEEEFRHLTHDLEALERLVGPLAR